MLPDDVFDHDALEHDIQVYLQQDWFASNTKMIGRSPPTLVIFFSIGPTPFCKFDDTSE